MPELGFDPYLPAFWSLLVQREENALLLMPSKGPEWQNDFDGPYPRLLIAGAFLDASWSLPLPKLPLVAQWPPWSFPFKEAEAFLIK